MAQRVTVRPCVGSLIRPASPRLYLNSKPKPVSAISPLKRLISMPSNLA